jgi:endonuclease YncB( thermonuclease family)
MTLTVLLAAASVYLVQRSLLSPRHEVSGAARVIDGDSLVVGGREIRIKGIDAPEGRQVCTRDGREWACGAAAADALKALVAGTSVTCRIESDDRFRRGLGACFAGRTNLGEAMVESGFAVAYGASYLTQEQEARAARRGLWSGTFEHPRDWRRVHMPEQRDPHR